MHASSHIFTTDVHHPLSRDLLRHRPCVRQQALPDRLDVLHAQDFGIPTADSSEVQVRVVRRHRSQHPRHFVEQPAPDKVLDRIRDLCQLDGGRASAWR